MKLAMRIGRHYRWREIQPRHFAELAKSCRYPPGTLLATLGDLAARLPDEASAIMAELRQAKIAGEIAGWTPRWPGGALQERCGSAHRIRLAAVRGCRRRPIDLDSVPLGLDG